MIFQKCDPSKHPCKRNCKPDNNTASDLALIMSPIITEESCPGNGSGGLGGGGGYMAVDEVIMWLYSCASKYDSTSKAL